MEYTQLLLTILVVAVLGLGGGGLLYLFKNGQISKEATKNKLYTIDQVLSVLYVIAKAVSDDQKVINQVYGILDELIEFGKEMASEDALDKQVLLASAYRQCELFGIEVTKDIETAVNSGVELIYIFVSE